MSDTLATYSFLPWVRQGLSNNITQADASTAKIRAAINVRLTVKPTKTDGTAGADEFVENDIELYGPGDIIGIDNKAIIKTEPRNYITNFEPNYLPFIEFYEEDFPWRYTPVRHNNDRLRPWIMLVILKEDEFENGQNVKDKPLPYFKLKDGIKTADIFPAPPELWAWAHVHVNTDLSNDAAPNTADPNTINAAITDIITRDPDRAYSRIVCPRKLVPNTGYHAFVIPSFESGRLSGLGLDIPGTLGGTVCSWENELNIEFPYYHRWYFRTGHAGDFEYLVNLLKPKPADKNVGVRDMDVLHPGSNLPPINNINVDGILKLGGALRVPFDTLKEADKIQIRKFDRWDELPYPPPFSIAMAKRVNLEDDYADAAKNIEAVNKDAAITAEGDSTKGDPDPVITSPLYGRWHALQQRLLKDRANANLPNYKNWVHELNLDPRFRVAAGFGTSVVQKNQEEYMQAAWEQVGKVIEANNKIRLAQLAKEVSEKWYAKHVLTLPTEHAFVFTAAVQKRVVHQQLTVYNTVQESVVPPAVTSGTFRSIMRPGGRTSKLLGFTNAANAGNLIQRINEGEVVIAPPRTDPKGAINLTDIAEEAKPDNIPGFIEDLLKKYKWFKYLPLIILLILLLIVLLFFRNLIGGSVLVVIATVLIWFYRKLGEWEKLIKRGEAVDQGSQTPGAVDNYPTSPDFRISVPGSGFTPSFGNTDSTEATKFKLALQDAFTIVNVKFTAPVRNKLDFAGLTTAVITQLNPALTIPKRTFGAIKIPGRIKDNMVETFTPVMVYPEIDVPMYKPLSDMSSELFLPNINLIEENSITLLENNQKFIESYMVGINHEMSRELLWREYPTDQRGSYFRQFWDVSSFLPPQPAPANLKEQLRDILPIHTWKKTDTTPADPADPLSPLLNELGQHNQRAMQSGKTQLVLVIRGELLKKYPTAVVYAHKADWGINPTTSAKDVKVERVFLELTDAEKTNPPADKLKTPLFEAKVDPDIYFFGFDLDDEEARGTLNPTAVTDNAGWFFVIKERPGEPRFGFDISKAKNDAGTPRLINWNNLSWEDIETADNECVEINRTITLQPYDATIDQENKNNPDDVQARWSPDTNSAELAYILYQVPVLVGVHASRMLPK